MSEKLKNSASSQDSLHRIADLDAEQALFGPLSVSDPLKEPLDGMIATFCANERPLQGLVGLLDWRFHGAISKYLRAGAILGAEGECAYLPIQRSDRVYHLLLIGVGSSTAPGEREKIEEKIASTLHKNIRSLKISNLGISSSDFGNAPKEFFSKHFKEAPLWIVR